MSWNGLGFCQGKEKNERSHLMLCPFAVLTIPREARVKNTME